MTNEEQILAELTELRKEFNEMRDEFHQIKGGLAVGKWIVGILIALAGLLGVADFLKQ